VYVQLERKAGILRGPNKLELSPDGGQIRALYDTCADPAEQINFADAPAYAAIRDDLAGRFGRWLADVNSRQGDTDQAERMSPALEAHLAGKP
jgi:hypothetical protein